MTPAARMCRGIMSTRRVISIGRERCGRRSFSSAREPQAAHAPCARIVRVVLAATGPLVEEQKQRIKSRIEQFLLTRFHYEKSADDKTNIQVSLERSDKARISDNYPFVSYSSGAVIITNNSVKNVFKIKRP